MHRLIKSSQPGDAEHDKALRLLTQRAVLTRALCQELLDSQGRFSDRRSTAALSILLQWVAQNLPESVRVEPHASDGIDSMVVPDDCQELLREIHDGAQVGDALFMLLTADNSLQADGDQSTLQKRLNAYWANHPSAAPAPAVVATH